MQINCTSLQTDNHASTSSLKFFYRRDALPDAEPTALVKTLKALYSSALTLLFEHQEQHLACKVSAMDGLCKTPGFQHQLQTPQQC